MSFSNTDTGNKPADPYKQANAENPSTETKLEYVSNFVTKCKFGMLTTNEASSSLLVSRCMAVAATESNGIDLLFHTNTESGKTDDISSNPNVNVSFVNSSGEWASIAGKAEIVTDRAVVKKHYSPTLKAWLGDLGDGVHDGSENDPRIGVIRVKMVTSTFAGAAKNFIARVAEIAEGALTGKTAEVNKLMEISSDEVEQYRSKQA